MNYYEHHLGDYAAATAHLSWDEDMAYSRLLRTYYHHERGITDGEQYRHARAITKPQRIAVDTVLREFFKLTDGVWRQKRTDEEIARYQDKQRKAKASAEARWSQSGRNANASQTVMPTDMRTHSEGNAPKLQAPDTNQDQEKKNAPTGAPPTPKNRKVTFAAWTAALTPGTDAIPADHAVFSYAAEVGIPAEYLKLAWVWFLRKYTGKEDKKYTPKGWPQIFQDSVEGNWGKLWWIEPDGSYKLTTVGLQLQRASAQDVAA